MKGYGQMTSILTIIGGAIYVALMVPNIIRVETNRPRCGDLAWSVTNE